MYVFLKRDEGSHKQLLRFSHLKGVCKHRVLPQRQPNGHVELKMQSSFSAAKLCDYD
jgi:hypothetical protein